METQTEPKPESPSTVNTPTDNEAAHARRAALDALHQDIVGLKIGLDNVSHHLAVPDASKVAGHWRDILERIEKLGAALNQHLQGN